MVCDLGSSSQNLTHHTSTPLPLECVFFTLPLLLAWVWLSVFCGHGVGPLPGKFGATKEFPLCR
jgi:hypothetical protein